jgi:phage tail tube protein FII
MNTNQILNKVRVLLGMEVKLEQMKLGDGVTVIEAESFEPEMEVFVVTEDEQKIALPVGEYELEDGRILVVEVEGMIKEVKEMEVKEEEAPEVETEVEVEAEKESTPSPKKTVESVIKESFFSEIEELKKENELLKAELSALKTPQVEEEVELSEEPKPISFNPENTNSIEVTRIATKRPRNIMDSVLSKLNK